MFSYQNIIKHGSPSNLSNVNIQRSCTQCEEEEVMQRKELDDVPDIQMDFNNTLQASKGSGTPLTGDTRHFMESRMGTDFSNVRIHTGNTSEKMNRDISAHAFTHGSDIYFNQNEYQPESDSGKELLAHELTHVIQQQSGPNCINRKLYDKHNLTSSYMSGNRRLENVFDGYRIVKKGQRGKHVKKIQLSLQHLGLNLGVKGVDGKFGTDTENAVISFQINSGMSSPEEWDGIVGKKTIALLDRSVRNDRIKQDKDTASADFPGTNVKTPSASDPCKGKPKETACPNPNTIVNQSVDDAVKMIDKVIFEQLPPKKTKASNYPDIFNTLFRNNATSPLNDTVKKVKKNFELTKTFLKSLKNNTKNLRCGLLCDGGCRNGNPAYRSSNRGGVRNVITLCPNFKTHKERLIILIHESHHAAVKDSNDHAYHKGRLIDKLDHKRALQNAASFHIYAGLVDKPNSLTIGQKKKDISYITNVTHSKKVNLALAHISHWFDLIPFDTSVTISGVREAKNKGKYKSRYAKYTMRKIFSKWFGLTKPPTKPNDVDLIKLQEIEKRFKLMEKTFETPFMILESNKKSSYWLKGPGDMIFLDNDILNLNQERLIIALLQELVHATPNISAELESLYVLTINDLRNFRNLDP